MSHQIMENEGLVTVVIPVFNAAEYLGDTLVSVQAQTYANWVCICVDDGSSDQSLAVARAMANTDARFKIYERPAALPKGGNSCRNYGFEQGRGDYVQFFDADDLMEPILLEQKLQALKADPGLDFVVSKMAALENGVISYPQYRMDSASRLEDFLAYRIQFLTPGPLFRRGSLENSGLFSTTLNRHQEWEFFSRLLIRGYRYAVLEEYHCIRRIHSGSINHLHRRLRPLQKNYSKMMAVGVLDQHTKHQAAALLYKLFAKRILWSLGRSLRERNWAYAAFFARLLLRLSTNAILRSYK